MNTYHHRPYAPKQAVLFPHSLDEYIPKKDPVRVLDLIIDQLDLTEIEKLYQRFGRKSYDPRMMLKVVIYAYMNNVYSCRKIEKLLLRDVHFMWLSGNEKPDFITINRFRNRLKDQIAKVFTKLVLKLVELNQITLDVEYIDGTKIESKANKYTFVWKKAVEKNRERLLAKIKAILEQVDESIIQDKNKEESQIALTMDDLRSIVEDLNDSIKSAPEPTTKEEKKSQKAKKKQLKTLIEHRDKLFEYDQKLEILGERNSYSKTDQDATFMRMKEDAMHNGQTKPGYNLQIGTENQYITDFGIYYHPNDTLTLPSFLNSFASNYGKYPNQVVADSGYGSEENYDFMEQKGVEAFVKYNYFHKEQRKAITQNPFLVANLFYNAEHDFYVCPMGQRMRWIGTTKIKTGSGYKAAIFKYQAQRCQGCPLRGQCFKAKGNRIIQVNHELNRHKAKARERLTSVQGLEHRSKRAIEPEAVFGQMKYNMAYRRFRHTTEDKVHMDFAFFAMAFNVKKLCKKLGNTALYKVRSMLAAITSSLGLENVYIRNKYLFSQSEYLKVA